MESILRIISAVFNDRELFLLNPLLRSVGHSIQAGGLERSGVPFQLVEEPGSALVIDGILRPALIVKGILDGGYREQRGYARGAQLAQHGSQLNCGSHAAKRAGGIANNR